jgi:1-phosphatidylinositol-3-phosphate 5-kinase
MQELAKAALPPRLPISESDQEYSSPLRIVRTKSKDKKTYRKSSASDFEQSYAANIAPKYLTHSRRNLGHGTRIPGPKPAISESGESSRRHSPEKRPSGQRPKELRLSGRMSPPPGLFMQTPSKPGRSKLGNKAAQRPASAGGSKSTFRRASGAQNGRVSSIAKQFEKMGKDADRGLKSRYSVIRGRRARPVATARAKVEVLDSVRDAIKDEDSESSSSSSEADDEGEGTDPPEQPESSSQELQSLKHDSEDNHGVKTAPPNRTSFAESSPSTSKGSTEQTLEVPPRSTIPGPVSLPPSPFLASRLDQSLAETPPADLDLNAVPDRHSIFKAISGFWLQNPPSRFITEAEDPMIDPEHIFRDSTMVVRTDEPTSIIALALK